MKIVSLLICLSLIGCAPAYCEGLLWSPQITLSQQVPPTVPTDITPIPKPFPPGSFVDTDPSSFCQDHPKVCAASAHVKSGAKKAWAKFKNFCKENLVVAQFIGAAIFTVVTLGLI